MHTAGRRSQRVGRRRSVRHDRIIVVHPLADVAGQVVQPGCLRGEFPDRRHAGVSIHVPGHVELHAAARGFVGDVADLAGQAELVAPRKHRPRPPAGAAGQPFPFRFGRQPIPVRRAVHAAQRPAGNVVERRQPVRPTEPVAEAGRVQPADPGHGQVVGPGMVGCETPELGVRDLVLAGVERLAEGDLPLGFVGALAFLVARGAHAERSGMEQDEFHARGVGILPGRFGPARRGFGQQGFVDHLRPRAGRRDASFDRPVARPSQRDRMRRGRQADAQRGGAALRPVDEHARRGPRPDFHAPELGLQMQAYPRGLSRPSGDAPRDPGISIAQIGDGDGRLRRHCMGLCRVHLFSVDQQRAVAWMHVEGQHRRGPRQPVVPFDRRRGVGDFDAFRDRGVPLVRNGDLICPAGHAPAQRGDAGRLAVDRHRRARGHGLNGQFAFHGLQRDVEFDRFSAAERDLSFRRPVVRMRRPEPILAGRQFALDPVGRGRGLAVQHPAHRGVRRRRRSQQAAGQFLQRDGDRAAPLVGLDAAACEPEARRLRSDHRARTQRIHHARHGERGPLCDAEGSGLRGVRGREPDRGGAAEDRDRGHDQRAAGQYAADRGEVVALALARRFQALVKSAHRRSLGRTRRRRRAER